MDYDPLEPVWTLISFFTCNCITPVFCCAQENHWNIRGCFPLKKLLFGWGKDVQNRISTKSTLAVQLVSKLIAATRLQTSSQQDCIEYFQIEFEITPD
jgi:hypothetical protein